MGATVLLIEDYSAHRALLHTVVGRMGCQAIEAVDGRSGIELARQHAPAIIVLDLILPDLDGVEVLRRLREEPTTALTPVLIVTAVDTHERVIEALEAGADDYVTKPFDCTVLQARMKVLLRAARLQRDLTRRAQQAESLASISRAAAAGSDLDDVCLQAATVFRLDGQLAQVHVFAVRDEVVIGPYGAPGVTAGEHSIAPLLQRAALGRLFCGEVPWQRVSDAELGALTAGLPPGEKAVVALRHGSSTVGLAVVAGPSPLRELQLHRVAELAEAAALAVTTAAERSARAESEQRYRLLFEQAGDGVVLLDGATAVVREANQAFAGWLSAMPMALTGRPFPSLFAPETAASIAEAVTAAAHGQRVSLSDLTLVSHEGQQTPVEVTFRRLRTPSGQDVMALVRDVYSHEALGRFEQTASDLTRLSRTVRALNHEINNPLTCIIGLTQLLQLRLKDLPEYLPQLDRILDSAEQITEFSRQLREIAVLLGGNEPLSEIETILNELPRTG
ncbi:MAG: response regulator [Armatimonadetes bacterium]|nr:response regulator [Armatimonadota bacterium]